MSDCAFHASLLVEGTCYWHLKQRLLADGARGTDEERRFAGIGYSDPRPRDRGWVPAGTLRWPVAPALERRRTFRASNPIKALVEALARISGERP